MYKWNFPLKRSNPQRQFAKIPKHTFRSFPSVVHTLHRDRCFQDNGIVFATSRVSLKSFEVQSPTHYFLCPIILTTASKPAVVFDTRNEISLQYNFFDDYTIFKIEYSCFRQGKQLLYHCGMRMEWASIKSLSINYSLTDLYYTLVWH